MFLVSFALLSVLSPQESAPQAQVKEKKICRTVDQTGSILGGKRECHTKREWSEMAARARDSRQDRDANRSLRGDGMDTTGRN